MQCPLLCQSELLQEKERAYKIGKSGSTEWRLFTKVWFKCRETLRFMVMLELLSLLNLKRQVEEEMTLVRRKSCTESKLEAKFDLGELNVFIQRQCSGRSQAI